MCKTSMRLKSSEFTARYERPFVLLIDINMLQKSVVCLTVYFFKLIIIMKLIQNCPHIPTLYLPEWQKLWLTFCLTPLNVGVEHTGFKRVQPRSKRCLQPRQRFPRLINHLRVYYHISSSTAHPTLNSSFVITGADSLRFPASKRRQQF